MVAGSSTFLNLAFLSAPLRAVGKVRDETFRASGSESSSCHSLHLVVAIITNIGVGALTFLECGRLKLGFTKREFWY